MWQKQHKPTQTQRKRGNIVRKKILSTVLLMGVLVLGVTGCGSDASTSKNTSNPAKENSQKELTLGEIENLAKQEGKIVSVGMPDAWANWKDTWNALTTKYGLSHTDTDLSSAEELAKFEAEKNNPTADIGDVGISYGHMAVEKGLTLPYKTTHWNDVPDWAKDDQGNWIVGYQGTLALITDKNLVKNPPKTWDELLEGNYKVLVNDPTTSNQGQMSILAAAIAQGGNEGNIQPGLDYFAQLAKQGRLVTRSVRPTDLEKGEVPVSFLWDFTALGYRDQVDPNRFEVSILKEGSVISAYTTIINKYAPHPNAAMLAREYMLSDEGQINFAKGYARPIRTNVKLPEEVTKKLLPAEQYQNAKPILDYKVWEKTSKQLPQLWQEQVLVHVK